MVNKASGPDLLEDSPRSSRAGSIDFVGDVRPSLTGSLLASMNSSMNSASSSMSGSLANSLGRRQISTSQGLRRPSKPSTVYDIPSAFLTVKDARLLRNEEREVNRTAARNMPGTNSMKRPATTPAPMPWKGNTKPSKGLTKTVEPVLADTLAAAFRRPPSVDGSSCNSSPRSPLKNRKSQQQQQYQSDMTRSASAAAATHRRSLPQWESAASREANQAIAFGRSSLLAPSTPPISDKLPETTAAWGFAPMTSIRRRSSREAMNSPVQQQQQHSPVQQQQQLHYRKPVRMAAQNPVAGQLPPHLASLLGPVVPLQPEKLDAAVMMAIHSSQDGGTCRMESCRMTQLPQQLARFMMVEGPCIHTLLLRDNRLEELPSLSHLPSLKLLDLSNNLFMHIPDSLGTCSLLHTLKLSHNLLGGEGPFNEQTLAALHALTDLDISNNEITELPHYIGVLKKLKVLRVERNALQTLPRDLFSIPSLTTLTASYNILTALPVEMGSAPSLTKLALDNNRISAVPTTLSGLGTRLKDLLLHNNELTILPREISYLNAVTQLTTAGNPLIFPPSKICKRGMQYIRHFMHSNAGGLGEEALATVLGQEGAERASKHSSSKLASGQHPAPAPDVSDPAPPEAAPVIKSVDTIDEEAPQAEALPAAPDSPQDEWPEDERPVFDNLGTIEEDAPHADPVPAAPDSPQDEWPEDERPASDNFESAFPRPPNNAIQPAGRSRLSACEDAGPAFPPPTKNAIQPAGRSRLSACENAGPSFKGVLSPEYLGLSSEALNDASSAKIEHGKSSLGEQSPDRLRRFDSAPTPGLASKPAALASASKPGAPSKGSEAEMLKSMAPSWDSPNCPKCTSNLFHVEQIGHKILSVQLEKEKVDRELELAKDLLSKLIAENHLNTKEIKTLVHGKVGERSDPEEAHMDMLSGEDRTIENLTRQANRLAIELREARGEAQGFQKRTEEAEEQLGVERARSNAAASVAGGSERNAQKAGELAAQVSEQAADIERLHKLAASHLSQYCEAEDRCLNAEARSDAMIGQMDGLQGEVGHLKTEVQIQIKKAVLENLEARQRERALQIENERLQAQIDMLMKERQMFCIA